LFFLGVIMTLAFAATSVRCANAIDGEIFQVTMDTVADGADKEERRTPYLLVGRNFEFPGPPSIEWHDGHDYDGGGRITAVTVRRDGISIELDRKRELNVTFTLSEAEHRKLQFFFKRIFFGSGILTID
jgi:hypothetical protein